MKPVWTFDRPEDYHARTDLLSASRIKVGLRSLAHLQAAIEEPREQTQAMALGSLIHSAVLEPETLGQYVVAPKFDRRTKDGKAQAEAFEAGLVGKKAVSEEDMKAALSCRDAVLTHPIAGPLLKGAKVESSIYWADELTGVGCKARPDGYNPETGLLLDLKSSQDAGPRFVKDIFGLSYHVQLAFYRMGIEAIGFPVERVVIIACEKVTPFSVGVFELDIQTLALGAHKVREFLPRYAEAQKTNVWKGYPEQIVSVTPPVWAFE